MREFRHRLSGSSLLLAALLAAPAVAQISTTWAAGERRRLAFRLTNHGPARWLAAHRGPGGAALRLSLRLSLASGGEDLLAGRPWLPLPRDLAAGESCRLEAEVRRPPGEGTAVLRAELRVAGVEAPGLFAETGARSGPPSGPWSGPAAEWEL
jgi:hypothetical protein